MSLRGVLLIDKNKVTEFRRVKDDRELLKKEP